MISVNEQVTSKCPNCGLRQTRTTYDIGNGSGPELACAHCEWCWGANGQPLVFQTADQVAHMIRGAKAQWAHDAH